MGFSPERAGGGDLSQLDNHVASGPLQDLASRTRVHFVSAPLGSLHPLEDMVPAAPRSAARAAAQLFGRQSTPVFRSSSPGRGVFAGLEGCAASEFGSPPGGSASARGPAPSCLAGWALCVHRVFPAVLAGTASRSLSEALSVSLVAGRPFAASRLPG